MHITSVALRKQVNPYGRLTRMGIQWPFTFGVPGITTAPSAACNLLVDPGEMVELDDLTVDGEKKKYMD